jgi:peroxidase family protein
MSTNGVQVYDPAERAGEPVQVQIDERRGPCPALNALANDGYLPRDGKVTVDQLVHALHERLGIAPSIGMLLAKVAMARLGKQGEGGLRVLDLSDLVEHGFIEHDASLTRADSRDGDAAAVCPPLLDQLVSMSQDGKTLTLEDLATAHQVRMAQSAAGGHTVPFKAGVLGTFEAALLYQVLRGSGAVAITEAREFLGTEHVPAEATPRDIGWGSLVLTAARLAVMGNSPFSAANRRARALAATPAPVCPFAHGAAHAAGGE